MEDVILNKITVVKSAEMVTGDPVPESGAKFEVYLKSAGSYANAKAAERDLITTGSNGKATTKDLPYGTYVIHQISGSAGRELADDIEVELFKDKSEHSYSVSITNNLKLATLELSVLKEKASTLEKEKEILLLKLECAEKLNAVHNFYNNIKT